MYIYIYTYICSYTCICIEMCIYTYTHTYIYIHVYVHVDISIYILPFHLCEHIFRYECVERLSTFCSCKTSILGLCIAMCCRYVAVVLQLCRKCIDVTLSVYCVNTIHMYCPSFLAHNECYCVISIYIYICMYVLMFIYVYTYIYIYMYRYIYIYIYMDEDSCVAVCCNVVPSSAEWGRMLQCVVLCGSVLYCVAV